ncbi:MAG: hypothetical protein PVH17_00030 [Anaerolineae bacterium]
MGKPDNPESFAAIQIGEWGRRYGAIYVPLQMWEDLRPRAQEFTFYVQDSERTRRCRIHFDVPVGRL